MKRREFMQHLREHNCVLLGEGAKHSIVQSTVTGKKTSLPRHTEIDRRLVALICKQLEIERPRGA
jgi:hypothetical protein